MYRSVDVNGVQLESALESPLETVVNRIFDEYYNFYTVYAKDDPFCGGLTALATYVNMMINFGVSVTSRDINGLTPLNNIMKQVLSFISVFK